MPHKAVIESHIPHVPDTLGEYFDIVRLAPEEITPDTIRDAEALIVRTRTKCNRSLLEGSPVEFIATATIGTDHIDAGYCDGRGIETVSAPGCNAPAVAQYVMASLLTLFGDSLKEKTIGIVGVGHVGSIVADWARQLGMDVMLCDPPRALRQREEAGSGDITNRHEDFVSLDEIARHADIITFHTPHTLSGDHPTHKMADKAFFSTVKPGCTIVNSARGPIVDTDALVDALDSGTVAHAVIDCWDPEPEIDRRLLAKASIATPHIAGYSLNGKIRATRTAVNSLCRHFGIDYRMGAGGVPDGPAEIVTPQTILSSYNPLVDTEALRRAPEDFESMRNNYPLRAEVC